MRGDSTHHKPRKGGEDSGVGQHVDLVGAEVDDLQANERAYVIDAADVICVKEKHAHVAQHADDAWNTMRQLHTPQSSSSHPFP